MPWRQLGTTWTEATLTVVTAVAIYATVIAFSRLWGQRQFAASSTYDLAFIFAMGSLVGRVVLVRVSLVNALLGLFVMFSLHSIVGWLHHHVEWIHRSIQNRPVLVAAGGEPIEEGLRHANTSAYEVHEAIRLSGYGSLDDVAVVILERNGEFSVIGRDGALDPVVFDGVVGADRLDRI